MQEAFISFLRSLDSYREQSDLQSWLFRILRRRIIDHYRKRGRDAALVACVIGDRQDTAAGLSELAGSGNVNALADSAASPSVYVRQSEQNAEDESLLSEALSTEVHRIKEAQNLRDLMILEGLFFAGIKNRQLAEILQIDEGKIAVVRHRILKRLAANIAEAKGDTDSDSSAPLPDDLLARVWESSRPSCLKRTTLGKSLIGILDNAWQAYVNFHVDTIGCRYCVANRDDLREQDQENAAAQVAPHRIFESTVGFMRDV